MHGSGREGRLGALVMELGSLDSAGGRNSGNARDRESAAEAVIDELAETGLLSSWAERLTATFAHSIYCDFVSPTLVEQVVREGLTVCLVSATLQDAPPDDVKAWLYGMARFVVSNWVLAGALSPVRDPLAQVCVDPAERPVTTGQGGWSAAAVNSSVLAVAAACIAAFPEECGIADQTSAAPRRDVVRGALARDDRTDLIAVAREWTVRSMLGQTLAKHAIARALRLPRSAVSERLDMLAVALGVRTAAPTR